MNSNPLRQSILVVAGLLFTAALSSGSNVLNIGARSITDKDGLPLPAGGGTLLQLVNLGNDGTFNPIDISDGTTSGLQRWVSGDDSVINVAYLITGSAPGDFPSTAAFDLAATAETAGRLVRTMEFEFGAIPTGTKIGVRWFPGLLASNFANITLAAGQQYGQFTRQSPDVIPVSGNDYWVMPGDGAVTTFSNLRTFAAGGTDPNVLGAASFVIRSIPEPTSVTLLLVGVSGLGILRRRQS